MDFVNSLEDDNLIRGVSNIYAPLQKQSGDLFSDSGFTKMFKVVKTQVKNTFVSAKSEKRYAKINQCTVASVKSKVLYKNQTVFPNIIN